jgi:hypothetical protein
MASELLMRLVVEAFDRCLLDGAVHALDLAVGPRVLGLDQPMRDTILVADLVEAMNPVARCPAVAVARLSANWMPLSVRIVWGL